MIFYGLKTCDTCRKAQKELTNAGLVFSVVDVRADGVSTDKLKVWAEKVNWQTLLNTRSTTWRNLDATDKANINKAKAITFMATNPTLIKRPVIEINGQVYVGWAVDTKEKLGL